MSRIIGLFGSPGFAEVGLLPEQIMVLNRLLDGGERGFEGGISAAQYQTVAKISKATATRHLSDLLAKGCLEKLPGEGEARATKWWVTARRLSRERT